MKTDDHEAAADVLVQITPRFHPQIDGLGDYSRLMALELASRYGLASRFVIGDPAWSSSSGPADGRSFEAVAVRAQNAPALAEKLEGSSTAILHYVTYGYHRRGVPFWVNRAIRRWKHTASNRRLIVVFHELWSSGPPWRSEFYFGWIQRLLIKSLHSMAEGSLTSTPIMVRRLEAILPGKTVFAPIPSCAPEHPRPPRSGKNGAVTVAIFGQEASRRLSARTHLALIQALEKAGLLHCIRIVGKGASTGTTPSDDAAILLASIPSHKIIAEANVPAERLSAILSESDLFLSYYPSAYLCKSSALMTAMSCGCLPLLPETGECAPLTSGVHVLGCDGKPSQIDALLKFIRANENRQLGVEANEWYRTHASWDVTARAIAGLVRELK